MLNDLIIGRAALGTARVDLEKSAEANCRFHDIVRGVGSGFRKSRDRGLNWFHPLPADAAEAMEPTVRRRHRKAESRPTEARIIPFRNAK